MALQYTLLDDEDLGIDYEDNLTTAVAVREEILANDVSSDILEATSTAMRTLLTSFGELFDPPGRLIVLFQFKVGIRRQVHGSTCCAIGLRNFNVFSTFRNRKSR